MQLSIIPRNDPQGTTLLRLESMLAAGYGYDMFFCTAEHNRRFARAGYLANIYNLMDGTPHAGRDAFWQQPLRAVELNGGLYTLPLSFGFKYVSINDSLPQPIIDRFTRNETISFSELLHIYYQLIETYPQYAHWYFSSGWCAGRVTAPMALTVYMQYFINFETRTADLTNSNFIDFLTYRFDIFRRPVSVDANAQLCGILRNNTHLQLTYANHVFHVDNHHLNPALAFADPSLYAPGRLVFNHARPVTDKHGQLLMDMWNSPGYAGTWTSVSFNAAGDSELAWEFTQYLISAFSVHRGHVALSRASSFGWGRYSMTTPILRDMFRPHVDAAFRSVNRIPTNINSLLNADIDVTCPDTFDGILARLEAFNEMPMATIAYFELVLLALDDYMQFMAGQITPEEYARRLQSEVSAWLAE